MEGERIRLESEFRQAQKMEVLGQLAGGVAHDFINMLMVLTSSAELLEQTLPANSKGRPYLEQFQRTTERAAAITRQLLAFSRKQVLDVKPVDLHEILTESEFMLPRLLGSDVQLRFKHHAARSWMQADPSQIEQVIANLAINARDAMPYGGKLTISTSNASELPASISAGSCGESAGEWLVLEVADTGSGMDEATRNRVFEPFFMTKPVGRVPDSVFPLYMVSRTSLKGRLSWSRNQEREHDFGFSSRPPQKRRRANKRIRRERLWRH